MGAPRSTVRRASATSGAATSTRAACDWPSLSHARSAPANVAVTRRRPETTVAAGHDRVAFALREDDRRVEPRRDLGLARRDDAVDADRPRPPRRRPARRASRAHASTSVVRLAAHDAHADGERRRDPCARIADVATRARDEEIDEQRARRRETDVRGMRLGARIVERDGENGAARGEDDGPRRRTTARGRSARARPSPACATRIAAAASANGQPERGAPFAGERHDRRRGHRARCRRTARRRRRARRASRVEAHAGASARSHGRRRQRRWRSAGSRRRRPHFASAFARAPSAQRVGVRRASASRRRLRVARRPESLRAKRARSLVRGAAIASARRRLRLAGRRRGTAAAGCGRRPRARDGLRSLRLGDSERGSSSRCVRARRRAALLRYRAAAPR